MPKKNDRGMGSIQPRGKETWRLRYRIGARRYEVTFKGTRDEAKKELRSLLKDGDDGAHVDPSKKTVGAWVNEWTELGCPGRRRKKVSERTLERYSQLLRTHVKPALGHL